MQLTTDDPGTHTSRAARLVRREHAAEPREPFLALHAAAKIARAAMPSSQPSPHPPEPTVKSPPTTTPETYLLLRDAPGLRVLPLRDHSKPRSLADGLVDGIADSMSRERTRWRFPLTPSCNCVRDRQPRTSREKPQRGRDKPWLSPGDKKATSRPIGRQTVFE